MREACAGRGIECDIYVQGLPVYYESFLLECPDAETWMSRMADGSFYPWGGQTFRRWMDQYSPQFLEYENPSSAMPFRRFARAVSSLTIPSRPALVTLSDRWKPSAIIYGKVCRPGSGEAVWHQSV